MRLKVNFPWHGIHCHHLIFTRWLTPILLLHHEVFFTFNEINSTKSLCLKLVGNFDAVKCLQKYTVYHQSFLYVAVMCLLQIICMIPQSSLLLGVRNVGRIFSLTENITELYWEFRGKKKKMFSGVQGILLLTTLQHPVSNC